MRDIEEMQSTMETGQMSDFSTASGKGRGVRAALPHLVFFGLAAAFMAVMCYAATHLASVVSYERDIWHHLAVYRELIAAPFNALNPHVATDDPSRSFSPWTVSVAIMARSLGLDAFGAIAISAIASSLSVLAGLYLFSKEYWRHAWAPALMLVTFFGTWILGVNHTGYHTIATFLYSISYPFGIVLGVGFMSWWLTLRALRSRRYFLLYGVLLTLISAALFITHQLQGLFAVGGALAFALFAGQAGLGRRLLLGAFLLGGLYLSQFWMYFDPVSYVLNPEVRKGHSAVRFLNYSLDNIPYILVTLGLSLLGVLGLVDLRTGRPRYELLLSVAVLLSGFVFLLSKDNWVSVRVVPLLVVFLQLGLVSFLLTPAAQTALGRAGHALRAVIVVALLLGLLLNITNGRNAYAKSRTFLETGQIDAQPITWSRDILAASDFAVSLVPEGSTVIAHLQTAFPMEATSLKVVAIPRLFAEVSDMLERQTNNRAFFDAATDTETRCAILAQYDVQMIVYRDYWLDDAVEAQLSAFGTRQPMGDMSFIPAADGTFEACAG